MRKILTAITAVALALSLVAQATPAAAVAGYDSAYAGESAFLTLAPGETGNFTVFFANTGTVTWVKGTSTQVDLFACLNDKVTCDVAPEEAAWNPGTWLSSTRYATQTQTSVTPGQIATYSYSVTVPAGTAAGDYDFNGDLGVSSMTGSAARVHPEGYFQRVTVGTTTTGTAATISSISPTTGSTAGGTTVTITGTNFDCTPAFPTVNFGANAATVTSCGATTLTVTSPAGAAGAASVTVTNEGAAASNSATFTYADTTRPTYNSVTVAGDIATVTFSEPVCRTTAWAADDWSVTVNGVDNADTGDSIPTCNSTFTNGVTTANVFLTTAAPNGSFVAVTLTETGGDDMRDKAGNTVVDPRSNTTTATAGDATAPTLASASGSGGSTTLTLNFSEPVYCADAREAGDITVTTGSTTIASTSTNTCPTTRQTAATSYTVTLASALASNTSYSVTVNSDANETQDVAGNDLAATTTTSFVSGAQDTSAPLLNDTRLVTNAGLTTNMDSNDVFTITFSEAMNTSTSGDTINVTDADTTSTSGTITCGANATCTFNADGTILTVTITGQVVGTGGDTFVSYPATITGTGGITDTGGNNPNIAGSPDRIIDNE